MKLRTLFLFSGMILGLTSNSIIAYDKSEETEFGALKIKGGKGIFKADYIVEEKIMTDDFSKEINRGSKPDIIKMDAGTGVLDKINVGVFSINTPAKYSGTQLYYPDSSCKLPDSAEKYIHISFLLYGIGEEKGKGDYDCSARFSIAPQAEFAKSKVDPYLSTPNLNIFINYDGRTDSLKITLREKTSASNGFGDKVLYDGICTDRKYPIKFEIFANSQKYIFQTDTPMQLMSGTQNGTLSAFAKLPADTPLASGIRFVKHTAESTPRLLISNYEVDYVKVKGLSESQSREPEKFIVSEHPEWKLVWGDEFNGEKIDEAKWKISERLTPLAYGKNDIKTVEQKDHAYLDGKGNAVIKFSYDKEKKILATSGLWSKYEKRYGYFESRLKLTKVPGWWGSFWLMKRGYNPITDGIEFDILEDFHKKGKNKNQIQHAIHTGLGGGARKTFTRDVDVDNWDDYHVFGMKWTPTETVMYIDGMETARWNFNDYVTTKPCNVIFSGCLKTTGAAYTGIFDENQSMPDYEMIDYVRVYEKEEKNKPPVITLQNLTSKPSPKKAGDSADITAEIKTQEGATIKEVWLFDNGYPLEKLTQQPFKFTVSFTDEYYKTKPYSTVRPSIGGMTTLEGLHAFAVFAMDSNGLISHSEEPAVFFVYPKDFDLTKKSTPYQGKPHKIPGKMLLPEYDEGGKSIAYWDFDDKNLTSTPFRENEGVDCGKEAIGHTRNNEWMKYTVEIETAGEYELTTNMASDVSNEEPRGIRLDLDEKKLCDIYLGNESTGSWSKFKNISVKGINLPAGKHEITVTILSGSFNIGYIDFKLVKKNNL